MDKLEKLYGNIVADLAEFRVLSLETEAPADLEAEFKSARRLMAIAEIAAKEAPCFGGGGSNPCPPLPPEYCT